VKTYLTTLFLAFIAILTPIKPMILLAFAAIVMDTYFGLWKTIRTKGWKAIRSRRLSDTITKSLLYVGAIVMIFLSEKYILVGLVDHYTNVDNILTKAFTGFCMWTEGKSINESYHAVTGKNLWNNFMGFMKRTREQSDK
jgi:hypothetical protein